MLLYNLKIWDGTAELLSAADAIEVSNSSIVAVGNRATLTAGPDDVDMGGAFVIPGLIDAHVHMCLNPEIKDPFAQDQPAKEELLRQMTRRAQEMLQAGITTARDLGGGQWLELELRDRINRGEVVGTRLLCSGQPITSVGGHCHFWGGEAENSDSAMAVIERQRAHGVDLIKIMATGGNITPGSAPVDAQFDADNMQAMVQAAKAHDYPVAAHCHGTAGIRNAAAAEVTTIEHCSWVDSSGWGHGYDSAVAADIGSKGIWVSPTIGAGWKRFMGSKQFEDRVQGNYRKMKAAGIKLVASTDAGIPNVRHHDLPLAIPVFAFFAELSNAEALRAATSDCAEAIGLGQVVGQIKPGFEADLAFYAQNPLVDLANLAAPAKVMARGKFI